MSGVTIDVKENKLEKLASDLSTVYTEISRIKNSLEEYHAGIRANWVDPAVEEFTAKFDEGMERIWDLLVAVDSIEGLFTGAANGYVAADHEVESL